MMSEWINVKNQLPLDSKNILIYSKDWGRGVWLVHCWAVYILNVGKKVNIQ